MSLANIETARRKRQYIPVPRSAAYDSCPFCEWRSQEHLASRLDRHLIEFHLVTKAGAREDLLQSRKNAHTGS